MGQLVSRLFKPKNKIQDDLDPLDEYSCTLSQSEIDLLADNISGSHYFISEPSFITDHAYQVFTIVHNSYIDKPIYTYMYSGHGYYIIAKRLNTRALIEINLVEMDEDWDLIGYTSI